MADYCANVKTNEGLEIVRLFLRHCITDGKESFDYWTPKHESDLREIVNGYVKEVRESRELMQIRFESMDRSILIENFNSHI